jgi:hypothetical protein
MLAAMTIQLLALVGLVLGAALYLLLVRRRMTERVDRLTMSRALSASNEIALARMRDEPKIKAAALAAMEDRPGSGILVGDRRSGGDRRSENQAGRGRGRRSGGDRRRGSRR